MIGIGLIALAFTILLVYAYFERRARRRDMGLPRTMEFWPGTLVDKRLPKPRDPEWPWPPHGHTRVGIDRRRNPDGT